MLFQVGSLADQQASSVPVEAWREEQADREVQTLTEVLTQEL